MNKFAKKARAVTEALSDAHDLWYPGERVTVRRLRETDIGPHYAAWFNDPDVRRYIKFARTAPCLADLIEYWRKMDANAAVDFLGIFASSSQSHIGNMKFEAGPLADEMHVGFLIGERAWRRVGVLRETVAPCIAELRRRRPYLRRVYLTVDPTNEAAIHAFTRLCFVSTGLIDHLGDLEMDYAGA